MAQKYTYSELGAVLETFDLWDPETHSILNLRVIVLDRAFSRAQSRILDRLSFFLCILSVLGSILGIIVLWDDISIGIESLNLNDFLTLPRLLLFLEDLTFSLLLFR